MIDSFDNWWSGIGAVGSLLASACTSLHAVMVKRDVRAAAGWAGICWLVPVVGPGLYLLLGINRIERRAGQLMVKSAGVDDPIALDEPVSLPSSQGEHGAVVPEAAEHLISLVSLVENVVGLPLLAGNRIDVLVDGDESFPAMIAAIDSSKHCVWLSTYIFDNDHVGQSFADALERAVSRGVEVRVLIDAVGARYSFPTMAWSLRRRGVPCARFLHSIWPWRMPYLNLRNHRKLLIIDADRAFTGGINIRAGHLRVRRPSSPIQDLHFMVEGPVVAQLAFVFASDWVFTTSEELSVREQVTTLAHVGGVAVRGIPDGPDKDLDNLQWTILAALGAAKHSVRIATPYFLPDETLIAALKLASLRGVRVEILMPEKNNFRIVKWASMHQLPRLVRQGCQVVFTSGPFDHSKVLVVDGVWSLVGSANWDPRSLRLNFEFDIECYDADLAARLNVILDEKIAGGRTLSLAALEARSPVAKVRDAVARLASPYL